MKKLLRIPFLLLVVGLLTGQRASGQDNTNQPVVPALPEAITIRFQQVPFGGAAQDLLPNSTVPLDNLFTQYQVTMGSLTVGGQVLKPAAATIDPRNFNARQTAQQLLTNLRAAAFQQKSNGAFTRQELKKTGHQQLAQLLLPHGHWLKKHIYRARRPGNRAERIVAQSFLRQLESRLQAAWNASRYAPVLNLLSSSDAPASGQDRTTTPTGPAALAAWALPAARRVALYEPLTLEGMLSVGSKAKSDGAPTYNFQLTIPHLLAPLESAYHGPEHFPSAVAVAQELLRQITDNSQKPLTDQENKKLTAFLNTVADLAEAEHSLAALSADTSKAAKKQLATQKEATAKARNTVQAYGKEPELVRLVNQQWAGSLLAQTNLVRSIEQLQASMQAAGAAKVAPAGEGSSRLYTGQFLIPVLNVDPPVRRVAHLFIADRGESVVTQRRARYVVCLQYSATSADFQDKASGAVECPVPKGYVGVSVELTNLERSIFVNALLEQLRQKDQQLKVPDTQKADSANNVQQQQQLHLTAPGKDKGNTQNTITKNVTDIQLEENLRDIFDDYIRQQERYALTPKAGLVLVGARVEVYDSDVLDTYGLQEAGELLAVDSVQMEVEEGNAVAIKAFGTYRNEALLFDTYAPISISSDIDLNRRWYRQRLIAQSSRKHDISRNNVYISLGEVLRYYPFLTGRTSDRSPADGVYTFRPTDALPQRTLLKVPTTKILQARVYTDLAGIANDRPNGLIQLEVSKKFILLNNFTKDHSAQVSFLNCVQPQFSLQKIEDANKRLTLSRIPEQAPTSLRRRVHTIDLLRYTNMRIGLAQNMVALRIPNLKSDFNLDFAAYLGRLAVRDSISPTNSRIDSTLNVLSYGPQLTWRVRPDPRYGFQYRLATFHQSLINRKASTDPNNTREIEQNATPAPDRGGTTVVGQLLRQSVKTIIQHEASFWASVSDNSDLFFRFQFSHLRYETYRTFFQMQLGYQFDVFTTRRSAIMPAGLFPK